MTAQHALTVRTDAVVVGDETTVTVTVDLPADVHIEPHEPSEPYLIPTVLTVDTDADIAVAYPEPVVKDLGWHDAKLVVLSGSVQFVLTGPVPAGTDRVSGTLRYQPCIGGACLPPRTVDWTAPLTCATSYSVLHALAA